MSEYTEWIAEQKRKAIQVELERYYTPSNRSSKTEMVAQLIRWVNSLNELHSDRLSSVGIDDMGDLADEVPVFRGWMNQFFLILDVWEEDEQL